MNYKMMGKFLSQILIVEAGFMVPALLISLYTGSRAAVYGFGLSILITAGVGALMYYFCRNSTRRFFAREGMVCVAGSWIAISFFGCLPFVFSREIPNFVDALFEIVSGFTTTGSSILGDVEALSPGIMYWRSFSHWLGGMGVLVFLLALSPNGERGKGYTSAACGESGTECEQAGAENAYNSKNFVRHIHGADIHQFPVSPVGKNAGF